jgi:ABC-2 type transport system ATP-binding protein
MKNVTKRYSEIVAVNDLNLSISSGEIFGLLGPNGSGKSTVMKMLLGLVQPDSGLVRVLNLDVKQDAIAIKQQVGYAPESSHLYEFLTGIEFLDFVGDIYAMKPEE